MSPRERTMVPPSDFRSYYGRAVIKPPVWKVPDVPGYLFLGGLAGTSASIAFLADVQGKETLAKVGHVAAAVGALGSVGALVHDLGKPLRFLNMLRVIKPTSPLSVGSWILSPFSALSVAAAVSQVTGIARPLGKLAGFGAGALGPPMATYTAVLISNTAVPSWHEAYPEMPFLFAGSAMASGGGLGILAAPLEESGNARKVAVVGAALDLAASWRIEHRLGLLAEPYKTGRAGTLMKAARGLTLAGGALAVAGKKSRVLSALSGASLLAASICTRFGVFDAGVVSAKDPKYTVIPQRERLAAATPARGESPTPLPHTPKEQQV